jgi:hypothetical protein
MRTSAPSPRVFPTTSSKAFPEVPAGRFLPLVVSFKFGTEKGARVLHGPWNPLGIGAAEIRGRLQDRALETMRNTKKPRQNSARMPSPRRGSILDP